MKIFISWSGELSHKMALIFDQWIPRILQNVETFVSSEHIQKGSRGDISLAKELEKANYGIFCLTKSSINAPWVNFEAGSISKDIGESRVYTVLYGLRYSEIMGGPLKPFQATTCEKTDILRLMKNINEALGENGVKENILEDRFEMYWNKLKLEFDELEKYLDLEEDFDCEGKFKGLKEISIRGASNSIFENIEHSSSIDILANTSKKLLQKIEDDIIEAVKNGCNVRIVISSPDNIILKDENVRLGLCKNNSDIIGEINEVLNQLQKMIQRLQDQKLATTSGSMQVRTFSCVPTCGIIIINNKILRHTPYLPYNESEPVPTFDIVNKKESKLFKAYRETFNRVWENSHSFYGIDFKLIPESLNK